MGANVSTGSNSLIVGGAVAVGTVIVGAAAGAAAFRYHHPYHCTCGTSKAPTATGVKGDAKSAADNSAVAVSVKPSLEQRKAEFEKWLNDEWKLTDGEQKTGAVGPDPLSLSERPDAKADVVVKRMLHVHEYLKTGELRAQGVMAEGKGILVAVLDSGIHREHETFGGADTSRVEVGYNTCAADAKEARNTGDDFFHGTHVAGILAGEPVAELLEVGIAPKVQLLPIKVLDKDGCYVGDSLLNGLRMVTKYNARAKQLDLPGVSVVCMSLSDTRYRDTDAKSYSGTPEAKEIAKLTAMDVAVVVAAGNHYARVALPPSAEELRVGSVRGVGMGRPAISDDCISVGALYPRDAGLQDYTAAYGCKATSKLGRLCPFTMRLPRCVHHGGTTVFAPGAPVNAASHTDPKGVVSLSGTSMATPVVAGLIALAQEQYKLKHDGKLPSVKQIKDWLAVACEPVADPVVPHPYDNVMHTDLLDPTGLHVVVEQRYPALTGTSLEKFFAEAKKP